jgi:hypothetical protein
VTTSQAAVEREVAGEEFAVGGENLPQIRLFELLRDITGRPLPRRIPSAVAWAAAWMEEHVRRARPPMLTRGTVKILSRDWPLDSARSVEKLSYHVTPLATGIQNLLERQA